MPALAEDAKASPAKLRIFSYLPNPRIWKATITARLCGVPVEVRGGPPGELPSWLWDFDARRLTEDELAAQQDTARAARTGFTGRLFKTDAFMDAHPFGTVPAAFSPDGRIGIFESNSIMRAVGRLGQQAYPAYGADAYTASRVDSFLDASLIFARDTQIYLLALLGGEVTAPIHAKAAEAFTTYLTGIERALHPPRRFLVGDRVTLADICFVSELALFSSEKARGTVLRANGLPRVFRVDAASGFPRAMGHYETLCKHEAFAPDVAPYLERLAHAIATDEHAEADSG